MMGCEATGTPNLMSSGQLSVHGNISRIAKISSRRGGYGWSGLVSMLLHGVALVALVILANRPSDPTPPDEQAIEVVFQPAEVPPPPLPPEPAPVVEAEPPPPPPEPLPVVEPESPPPPQQPEKVVEPTRAPPPPEPAPIPERKLIPPTPPPPKPPPRPRAKTPAMTSAPVAEVAPPRPAQPSAMASPQTVAPPVLAPIADPSWQASVFGWLASRKTYPEEARRRGEEGRVAIRFTIDRSGRVLDAAIVSASGSQRLDEAALALLQRASLPPFPVTMAQARITITTTMRYSLR
jgi:protein TonB